MSPNAKNQAGKADNASNAIVPRLHSKIPDLNPSTLLSLTKKIEINLKKPIPEKSIKPPHSKAKKKRQDPIPSPRKISSVASTNTNGQKNGRTNGQNQRTTLPFASTPVHQPKNKRVWNSQSRELSSNRIEVDRVKPKTKTIHRSSIEKSELEKEVVALGGTIHDFELVDGAPSDSEMETQDPNNEQGSSINLKKDLLKLVRGQEVDEIDTKEPRCSSESGVEDITQTRNKGVASYDLISKSKLNKSPLKFQPDISANKGLPHLHFEPRPDWHSATLPLIPPEAHKTMNIDPSLSTRIYDHAVSLLELENKNYTSRNQSSSSAHHFYSTIMSSGTLSDKISALTLSVQESPVHNMKALENLVGLAKKRSRGQAVEVLGALKDLLGRGALLPSDRKLRVFAGQPGLSLFGSNKKWLEGNPLPNPLTEAHLISWAYENWLKSTYFDILKILESWCNDEVVFARTKAIDYVYLLLKEKPEQEANLLRLLVNKLGDTDKKIASRASHNILQLETTHPLMKPTIIGSIESDLLLRPGQSLHAKYYAVITLNQTVLSGKEADTANKLLHTYFSLFLKLLERPKNMEIAIPKVRSTTLNSKGEVQGGGGASGKKSQRKVAAKEKGTNSDEDLREKMLSAVLTGVNRAVPFAQTDDENFEKHLDTLYRVTHSSNFNTSIQALMLIQQLHVSQQGSNDRFYRTLYESLLDPRILTSSKQALYLNLLFKALKSDLNIRRVKAFSKRLLQVAALHQASFACGTLYLLRELESVFKNLPSFVDQPAVDDSDEENFQDVRETADDAKGSQIGVRQKPDDVRNTVNKSSLYDGRKRDPEYSNADKSCLWELTPLMMHFHPSVALFASKLMNHEPMPPKPDLSSHTLIHFLDRFVYKNPKIRGGARGSSIMQPVAGNQANGLLISTHAKSRSKDPVNTEAFWKQESGKVDANEVFFHTYFNTMGRGKERAKRKKTERNTEADGGSEEDEDEDEIWKALVDSRPELKRSDSSDDDIDLDNLSSADENVDDGTSTGSGKSLQQAEISGDAMELDDDDDGALFRSDDEIPSDMDQAFTEKDHVRDEEVIAHNTGKHGKKRRKLKNLPTFATADDYAAILSDGE